jgi:hypothetical protein
MRKITVMMTALATDNEQTGVSPRTVTATGNSREFGEFARCEDATYLFDVTAKAGTSPTLDITIQGWDETAGKWRTETTLPQATTVSTPIPVDASILRYKRYRAVWTVGGSAGQSFTFSLAAIARSRQ